MNRLRLSRMMVVGVLMGVLGAGVVHAQPPIGDVKPVAKGELIIGENRGGFDEGGANIWKYKGSAGERLTLMVAAENPANNTDNETRQKNRLLDTVLVVYDPTNQVIAYNDDIVDAVLTDSFLRAVELKVDGTYTVKVTNWFTENGDETGGHFTMMVYSNKAEATPEKITPKIVGKLNTATEVMDQLDAIIKNSDTHTVMLINPSYCTITGGTFGDLKFNLKPYSGIVVTVPDGSYVLRGKGDSCELNGDEIQVPQMTTVMVVPISAATSRPSDAVPFPTDKDALANS